MRHLRHHRRDFLAQDGADLSEAGVGVDDGTDIRTGVIGGEVHENFAGGAPPRCRLHHFPGTVHDHDVCHRHGCPVYAGGGQADKAALFIPQAEIP